MGKIADDIKELHQDGIKGILNIILKKGTLKKREFILSLIVSIAIGATVFFKEPEKSYDYLKQTVELLISFFPNLLGFSLGGYALVVGFSNLELIKAGTRVDKHSVYQILNAIFSLCLIFQVFTTLSSFVISWIIRVNIVSSAETEIGYLGVIINGVLLMILIFSSLYSLLLTPYVITNLFTLSQVNDSFLAIQKLTEEKKKKETSNAVAAAEKTKKVENSEAQDEQTTSKENEQI